LIRSFKLKLKILLVKPLVKYPLKNEDVGIPLGLMYLSSYIKRFSKDIEVSLLDCRLNKLLGRKRDIERELSEFDVVATSACTSEFYDACNILREAKNQGKITVMGGLFPTFNSEFALKTGCIDFVVRGEGETTFLELLESIQGKKKIENVKGISFKAGNKIIHNPCREPIKNLNELPLPDYDVIQTKKYLKYCTGAIYSSRGCTNNCVFCSLNKFWDFKCRARSIKNVVKEIELLKSLGFERIHFKDESLTLNQERARKLFSEIRKRNLNLNFKAKSRVDGLDQKLLKVMVGAGVDTVSFGVESVWGNSLKRMLKGSKVNKKAIEKCFHTLLSEDCNANPSFILGWLGETRESLEFNKEFIERWGSMEGVITYLGFITPHPGLGLYEHARKIGLKIISRDFNRYTHLLPVAFPESMGSNGLEEMTKVFNEISVNTNTQEINPLIREDYLSELIEVKRVVPWKLKSKQNAMT